MDSHHLENKSRAVPHCEIIARWTKQEQDMQTLEYLVNILGTAEEKYFTIIIDPIEQESDSTSPATKSVNGIYRVELCRML